jgi:hypothetical protein
MLRIISSLTLQANLFHEFHPIGGVRARLFDEVVFGCVNKTPPERTDITMRTDKHPALFMQAF